MSLDGDEAFTLSLLQVESDLRDNRRSAESLLAAFRATDDPALLREAVEKYPNDPRVNFVAYFAFRNESSPEDRRQRPEAFKQSAPDNALANCLSAQDRITFFDRTKVSGEIEASRWDRNRLGSR